MYIWLCDKLFMAISYSIYLISYVAVFIWQLVIDNLWLISFWYLYQLSIKGGIPNEFYPGQI